MGAVYVSTVFSARCDQTQNDYVVCNSRVHTSLNSLPSLQKMAFPMEAKKGAIFLGCSDLNPPYLCSLSSSSSSPSVVYNSSPATPIRISAATPPFPKLLCSFLQLQRCLAIATLIKAMHSSSTSSIPPSASTLTKDDGKAPLTLSEQWRDIQGERHWAGLLDHPINATLRAEIIRYGEFAQVCYDAFDFNQHSLYCGSCKYNRKVLFEKVDKEGCGYEVTKYLYATSKLDLPKFFKNSEMNEERRWSRDSNWIGYVAECTDEAEVRRIGRRDILIAWRGTVTKTEWVDDLMTTQAPANIEIALRQTSRIQKLPNGELAQSHAPANFKLATAASDSQPLNPTVALMVHSQCPPTAGNVELQDGEGVVKVESGFLSLYSSSKASSRFNKLSAGQQMAMEVKRLLQKYEGEDISISVVGHSLGAALALLCAYDIAANVAPSPNMPPCRTSAASGAELEAKRTGSRPLITVFSFAGPRVGNRAFRRRLEEVGVKVLRIVNVHDCVPKVPGLLFNEHSLKVWSNTNGYYHVGKELLIDFDLSPHLRHTRDLPSHHNLEAHLHVLDGFHGFTRPFQSVFGRNPILVNKSSDFLQKEAFIPPSWWQESNKGLVKDPLSGQWILGSREDDHLPEIHHSELPKAFM